MDSRPPETLTEYVTEAIRDQIVTGVLKPGQKLSVYSLATELGVSRVPLREAVRQLEAESLVDNVARRGTVVRPLSVADVTDSFEILESIEVIAARRAAESQNRVTTEEMRFWFDRMAELIQQGYPSRSTELLHAHRAFHFALFKGSGDGGVLQRHLCMLWNTAERYVINSRTEARQKEAMKEHESILLRIEAKDSNGTANALQQHIRASFSATIGYLEEQGFSHEPGAWESATARGKRAGKNDHTVV